MVMTLNQDIYIHSNMCQGHRVNWSVIDTVNSRVSDT